jgi:VWFA-related protein
MSRVGFLVLCFVLATAGMSGQENQDAPIVFRSDVALVRVDAQVTDRSNRAITGLTADDFVLRENGVVQEIRNFASEDLPVDILLLLDVSGSMRPHVERVASAAQEALRALGPNDRIAVMVFDRATRVRMPFRSSRGEIMRGIDNVLNQENFSGGTDITRAFYDAARYVAREGRRDARRAIVILTDDETEFNRDDVNVARTMNGSGIVVSALLAPDALGTGSRRYPGGGSSRGGGGMGSPWPSGGPLGGIIFGRRGPMGGGGGGPVIIGGGRSGTRSAGTAEVARNTGGDSMRVDDAYALQTTFERIRQRYALHFNLGNGVRPGQESVQVTLSSAAARRYPGAEVNFRRVSMSGDVSDAPVVASTVPVRDDSVNSDEPEPDPEQPPRMRRRPAVNDRSGSAGPQIGPRDENGAQGGWRKAGDPEPDVEPEPVRKSSAKDKNVVKDQDEPPAKSGGWRKIKPGEQP